MNYALYLEYIGDQRHASTVKMLAGAATLDEINAIYAKVATRLGMYRYRCEDWSTGATVWIA